MIKKDINKLWKKREALLERLAFYNDPPMFNTKNYEPHKNRIRKKLNEIANTLYVALKINKKKYAL